MRLCDFCKENKATEPVFDEQGTEYLICSNCDKEIYDNKNIPIDDLNNELTVEESKELLKMFFDDDVIFKATIDTLNDKELIDYVKQNKKIIMEKLK